VVNGELRELTYPIEMDARVRVVKMSDTDGSRIYRRSITFLLEAAFEDLYPDADISVDHSMSSGGFYCTVINRPPLHKDELARLENHMKELVKQIFHLSAKSFHCRRQSIISRRKTS